MEEWKLIKDFPEYQVSNLGRVKSLNYNRGKKEGILQELISDRGYCRVALYQEKKKHKVPIHRLVGQAFITNPENKPQIDHIDRNKSNNKVENLRWATTSENCLNKNYQSIKTNTGESYISLHKNIYHFRKTSNYKTISKYFKTLEEAIAYRDSILIQNPSPQA